MIFCKEPSWDNAGMHWHSWHKVKTKWRAVTGYCKCSERDKRVGISVLFVFKRVKAKIIRMEQKKGSSSSPGETNTFKYSINSRGWRKVKNLFLERLNKYFSKH